MAGSGVSDYYAVLGVSRGASADEIRTAYLKQAMKWHPDKRGKKEADDGEATARLQQIQQAYKVLSDPGPAKKAMYDAGLYDPSADNDEDVLPNDFLGELAAMMDNYDEAPEPTMEELSRLLADIFVEQEQRKKKGEGSSTSSSSPTAVRIDIAITHGGSSTPAGGTSGGSRAAGPRRRVRRRPAPSPIIKYRGGRGCM